MILIGENTVIHEEVVIPHHMEIGNNVTIEKGVRLGHHIFIGNNVTIRRGCHIGSHVVIGHGTVIEKDCFIGNRTRIQALVYLATGTRIARKVFIGPMVCTTNDKRILSHGRGDFTPDAPIIEFGVRIGARVLILPGVTIEKNALIGAGAIIADDASAGQVWKGTKGKWSGVVPKEELLNE